MRVVDLDYDMSDVIPTGSSRDAEFLFERMTDETLAALRAAPGARVVVRGNERLRPGDKVRIDGAS